MKEKQEEHFNSDLIKKEVSELDKKINKIMDLMLDNDLQIDAVKNKLIEINNKKTQLEKLLIEQKKPDKTSLIKETTKTIKDSWRELNLEEKNELLRRLIKVIWIDGNNLEIEWNF